MLNKKLCEECNEIFQWGWFESDEERWKKGGVLCPRSSPMSLVSIKDIPSNCPDGLEHLIANRQEEIDKKELEDASQISL